MLLSSKLFVRAVVALGMIGVFSVLSSYHGVEIQTVLQQKRETSPAGVTNNTRLNSTTSNHGNHTNTSYESSTPPPSTLGPTRFPTGKPSTGIGVSHPQEETTQNYTQAAVEHTQAKQLMLEFVHVPKAAGSAIEKAAARVGVAWGACHWRHDLSQEMGCPEPPNFQNLGIHCRQPGCRQNIWHVPTYYWNIDPMVSKDTFCVVRNPYERVVSLFYDHWSGYNNGPNTNNTQIFNQFIQLKLQRSSDGKWRRAQSHFVYNTNGKQVVNHVLKYENLTAEFPELMQQYNLTGIRLDEDKYNHGGKEFRFQVSDLNNETLTLIEQIYDPDFDNFGYQRILGSSTSPSPTQFPTAKPNNQEEDGTTQDNTEIIMVGDNKTKQILLEFVHVPKAAGSAIEKAAARVGIAWGACHWKHGLSQEMGCPQPPNYQNLGIRCGHPGCRQNIWHVPTYYWNIDPSVGKDTFCVVRNPYDRIVSLFYDRWHGYNRRPYTNDTQVFNKFIQLKLRKSNEGKWRGAQSPFVYNTNGTQVVNHVLRYENLTAEFPELMRQYNLTGIRLDEGKYNHGGNGFRFQVSHLNKKTLQMIEQIYDADFDNFGYQRILGTSKP